MKILLLLLLLSACSRQSRIHTATARDGLPDRSFCYINAPWFSGEKEYDFVCTGENHLNICTDLCTRYMNEK